MSTDPAHSERRDDIAAYALGALDPVETRELEAHLDGCRSCRGYLAELRPGLDVLAASVPQVEAPPELRERLVETVRAEAERIEASTAPGEHARPSRWRSWRGIAARPATAIAAGVVLVGGLAAGWLLHGSGTAGHTLIPAKRTAAAPPGSVSASLDRVDGAATLEVRRMPPLRGRDVYEVWTMQGRAPRPQSTFVLSHDGTANAAVPHLEGASAVLVTQEPHGGSQHPTSAPLLRAELAG
jgi:anti-sigma-K factor RskA